MQRIADKKDALDSSICSARELNQSIDSRSGTLRISLEYKAFVGTRLQSSLNVVNDISRSCRGILVCGCWVDGIVDFAVGELGHDVLVHGDEAGGGTLLLAGTSGVDDGCMMGLALIAKW
jgi:hypothetical protein